MLKYKARLTSIKELKRQTNLVFTVKEEVDEIDLMQSLRMDGYLLFNQDDYKKEVEDVMKNRKLGVSEEGKSKSQILRGVIWQLWSNGHIKCDNAEDAYNQKMNQIINHLKSKLS